ncbi:hypothetical protein EHQ12_17345 [Leptospira gomenensis]|uniref:PEGA domain-containing protein n=1 Tax=Leptospira gomenensis TaxID=2484974 RepID=A0A5F1YZW6_9LEPT|nr:hypothetical protein [Leptospira gomenensis]TGK29473.1 hypothetical protein EHQ17_15990 [Leptospira gomenensis]TGK33624.1 hypothetical protein EHQ12_17345 [Leptospira gomenensis]TGK44865.1 hypothetical protein EHQ07_11300 [Leptospira gomenensis]TGK64486.1 hypothetical protein EHQ13_07385 [Leptospira gomenensis]
MKNYLSILAVIAIVHCAPSTMVKVNTEPAGLEVYYQGMKVGKAPVDVEMSNIIFEKHVLEIRKDKKILRTVPVITEVKSINIIGGICFLVPFIWVSGPKSYQNITIDDAITSEFSSKKEAALVVSHLPQGVTMTIGARVLGSEDYAYVEAKDQEIKLCDSESCKSLGIHNFETEKSYFYQVNANQL